MGTLSLAYSHCLGHERRGLEPACPKRAAEPEMPHKARCLKDVSTAGKNPPVENRNQGGTLSASIHYAVGEKVTAEKSVTKGLLRHVSGVKSGMLLGSGNQTEINSSAGPMTPPCAERSKWLLRRKVTNPSFRAP